MKKKIVGTVVDILLIAAVFAITDAMMLNVFHSENLWLELGIYIVFYGIVYGTKSLAVHLWKRSHKKDVEENNHDEPAEQ